MSLCFIFSVIENEDFKFVLGPRSVIGETLFIALIDVFVEVNPLFGFSITRFVLLSLVLILLPHLGVRINTFAMLF